jgi:hypothetical protein
MSGAASLTAGLHAAAEPLLSCDHAAAPLRFAASGLSDDLTACMAGIVPLILECEAAAEAMERHAKRLRTALADAMDTAGATTIKTGHHTASVSSGRAAVVITDPAAIPPELMRTPAPVPDKAAIGALLKAGHAVEGAVLGNGGQPILTIKPRSPKS